MTATGQEGTDHFPFGAETLHTAPVWATTARTSAALRTRSPELLRNGFALQTETEHAQATSPAACGRQPTSRATAAASHTAARACGPQVSGRTRNSDQYACGDRNWAANKSRGDRPSGPNRSERFGRYVQQISRMRHRAAPMRNAASRSAGIVPDKSRNDFRNQGSVGTVPTTGRSSFTAGPPATGRIPRRPGRTLPVARSVRTDPATGRTAGRLRPGQDVVIPPEPVSRSAG